jgi:hypothetical protein
MGDGGTMQEQLSRATHGAVADDYMDAGGRATHGAVADDCMDAGGRATHGAVAEIRHPLKQYKNWIPAFAGMTNRP